MSESLLNCKLSKLAQQALDAYHLEDKRRLVVDTALIDLIVENARLRTQKKKLAERLKQERQERITQTENYLLDDLESTKRQVYLIRTSHKRRLLAAALKVLAGHVSSLPEPQCLVSSTYPPPSNCPYPLLRGQPAEMARCVNCKITPARAKRCWIRWALREGGEKCG